MTGERESKILARDLVTDRVARMLDTVHSKDPHVLDRLRLDAIGEMQRWKSISITRLSTAPDSTCNIAGIYVAEANPPQIGILDSVSRRRASFTALHEFGHHLQTSDELVNQLGSQPDRGRALEEMTSDLFAARVLIPDNLINQHLGSGTPTAQQVVGMYEDGTASRAAVCVAAVQRLRSPGHVILLDTDGIVDFSASHIEFPLRRGVAQTDAAVMKAFANRSFQIASARSRFAYRNGAKGPELYAQAAEMHGYTVIVAVSDGAPWERMSLSSREEVVVGGWHTCPQCGHDFRSWDRCESCLVPKCPECGRCNCPSLLRERECTNCHLVKGTHLFPKDGELCEDCA
jgi:hypothetical protein